VFASFYNLKDPTFNLRNVMPSFSTLADHCDGKTLIRLLALLLAFAVAPPVLLAQVPAPTGAWLIRTDVQLVTTPGVFFLTIFHQGGTLTQDIRGESAY